ncbi:MAG: hypothetical protein WAQ28_03495 [Bacteroidia bacterium]
MAKQEYEITIEAETPAKCDQVMQAVIDLKKSLTSEEIIKLAQKIKNDPSLIKKARTFGLI